MIPIYLAGESYAITLPGDRDPKTIFHVYPVRVREDARRDALQAFLIGQKQKQAPSETTANVLAAADEIVDTEIKHVASRIAWIENPWPDGKYARIEGQENVEGFLESIGREQYSVLNRILNDGNLLRELTFRRDNASVAIIGARENPQGDKGSCESTGRGHVRLPGMQESPSACGEVLLAGASEQNGMGDNQGGRGDGGSRPESPRPDGIADPVAAGAAG